MPDRLDDIGETPERHVPRPIAPEQHVAVDRPREAVGREDAVASAEPEQNQCAHVVAGEVHPSWTLGAAANLTPTTGRRQMLDLVRSFHALERSDCESKQYPGEFDPVRFAKWAKAYTPGSGARHAARFVLAVWSNRSSWGLGRFDVMEALGCWDNAHRAAFMAWAKDPWWP